MISFWCHTYQWQWIFLNRSPRCFYMLLQLVYQFYPLISSFKIIFGWWNLHLWLVMFIVFLMKIQCYTVSVTQMYNYNEYTYILYIKYCIKNWCFHAENQMIYTIYTVRMQFLINIQHCGVAGLQYTSVTSKTIMFNTLFVFHIIWNFTHDTESKLGCPLS